MDPITRLEGFINEFGNALSDLQPITRLEGFIRGAVQRVNPRLTPEVTSADNGKVLTVVSGDWAAANAAAGGALYGPYYYQGRINSIPANIASSSGLTADSHWITSPDGDDVEFSSDEDARYISSGWWISQLGTLDGDGNTCLHLCGHYYLIDDFMWYFKNTSGNAFTDVTVVTMFYSTVQLPAATT